MQLLTFLLLFWSMQATSDLSPVQEEETEDVNRIALGLSGENRALINDELLQTARKAGINLLETDSPEDLRGLGTDPFLILLSIRNKFMTPDRMGTEWREIAASTIEAYQLSETIVPGRVVALNLFQYPDDRSERFFEYSTLIADTLRSVTDLPIYYQTIPASPLEVYLPFSFKSFTYHSKLPRLENTGNVIHFTPSDQLPESLLALENLFSAFNKSSESVIIIPAGWFSQLLEQYPDMTLVFSSFAGGNPIPFPLPEGSDSAPGLNLPVFLLLSIWGGFMVLYKKRPMFNDKISRYFLHHQFFIQDVVQNRNRNLADAIYLLGLHVTMSALFFYTLSLILFGNNGLNVFSTHYPFLFIENHEPFSFLVSGFVISAFLHTISIFWLFLFNKKLKRVSQIVNLYSWGFTLNLVPVTFLVFCYLFGWGSIPALIITLFYVLVWFFSFNIAAVNSVQTMDSFKVPYILLTIGLQLIVMITLPLLLVSESQFIESLNLAYWLSK